MNGKVFITGAGGYIGSNAVRFFLEKGYSVTGLFHRRGRKLPGAEYIQGDLCEPGTFAASLRDLRPDYILHIGACASDVGRESVFEATNFHAATALASLAMELGVRRFVDLSTSDVYGLHDFHGESEDELQFDHHVRNPYPKYKIRTEEWLAVNLPPERYSVVRPCAVWGNGDTTLTPRAVAYLRNFPVVLHFGKWRGKNRWPLAHVENVCRTLYAAMLLPEAGGKGAIVLDPEFTTVSDFYRMIAAQYLPEKKLREWTLPLWTILPAAWFSTTISNLLNRRTPLYDPSLYALATITSNLDFSSARMLEWLRLSGQEVYRSSRSSNSRAQRL